MKEVRFYSTLAWLAAFSLVVTLALIFSFQDNILTHLNEQFSPASNLNVSLQTRLAVNRNFRHQLGIIGISAAISIVFLAFFLARHRLYHLRRLWPLSAFVTLVFTTATMGLGILASAYIDNDDMDIIIHHKAELLTFKQKAIARARAHRDPEPVFIPTGFFVQSIEFTNSNNCILTGYVWQRYLKKDKDTIEYAFLIPEAQDLQVNESYRKYYGDTVLVGWTIKANIREIFDFRDYPMDNQNLWVRFWHKQFDKNIILVPDLEAYTNYNVNHLPGIEKHIVLPGWHMQSAFFGYKFNDYNSNFGIRDYVGLNDFPELYFNLFIKREFASIFVSDIVPVIMVITLMFITMLVMYKDADAPDFFRFNVVEVISLIASLLFVLILAQIQLRSKISTDTILYLEYHYFVAYVGLFIILINFILYKKGNIHLFIIEYGNNYLPKVLFLPVINFILLVLTFIAFY